MNAAMFDQLDTNGDGFLSVEEIQRALSNPDIKKDAVDDLFETFDENEDGLISREEAMKKLVQIPAGKEKLIEQFKILDINGDGVLTFDEFYEGMKDQMSQEEIESVYRQLDKDNDESISLEEFIMSQIFLCHHNLKSSQMNIDRSTACLTEVMENLSRGDNMEACMKMLQVARKRQLMASWPNKKNAYKKTSLNEYKAKVDDIFLVVSKGQKQLDKAGVIEALGKFGKYVDSTQVNKLFAQVGIENELTISSEQFLQITFKLLAKEVKSKTEQRLSALSRPKNKSGELTVEDHLQELEAQGKQSDTKDKQKKTASKGNGKTTRNASSGLVKSIPRDATFSRVQSSSGSSKNVKDEQTITRSQSASGATTCTIRFEFDRLDVDGDGVLSPDELFEGLKHRMEQDELAELFDFMDGNGDGIISFEEFYEAKMKMALKKPTLSIL